MFAWLLVATLAAGCNGDRVVALSAAAERSFDDLLARPLVLRQRVEAGTWIEVEVHQFGTDVALQPSLEGRPMAPVDGSTGGFGAEVFRRVVASAGTFELAVRAHPEAVPGFDVWVGRVAVRPARPEDLRRSTAEIDLWNGVARRRGGDEAATEPLRRALATFEDLGDGRRAGQAAYQLALAVRSDAAARELAQRACRHLQSSRSWLELGAALEFLSDLEGPQAAVALRRRSLAARRRGLDWFGLGVSANNLALLQRQRNRIEDVLGLFRVAVAAFDRVPEDAEVAANRAAVRSNLGRELLTLRNLHEARAVLDAAVRDWRRAGEGSAGDLVDALVLRAIVLAQLGEGRAAQADLDEVQAMAPEVGSGILWNNSAGIVALERGAFEVAIDHFAVALAGGVGGAREGWLHHNLGRALLALGRLEGARREFREAAQLFRRDGDSWAALIPEIGELECLYRLADPTTPQRARELIAAVEGQRSRLFGFLDRGSYLALRRAPFRIAALAASKSPEIGPSWNLIERSHGRLLEDQLSRLASRRVPLGHLHAYRAVLSAAVEEIIPPADEAPPSGSGMVAASASRAFAALEGWHRRRDIPSLSAAELRQALPPGSALLTFEIGAEEGGLWILAAHESRFVPLPGERDLGPRVERALAGLRDPRARLGPLRQDLRSLGEELFGPARDLLAAYPHWLVMADGSLAKLPLDVLVTSVDGWPGEQRSIRRIHSATSWVQLEARSRGRRRGRGGTLLADPWPPGPGVAALPGSRAEVWGALPWAREGETFHLGVGRRARAAVLERLSGVPQRYLQLGTHVEINDSEPALSRFLLAPDRQRPGGGDLYGWQIYDLDLRADLVILSGCESGLGRPFAGDGFLGLTHPFLVAGARQVMVTLWKVDDRSTAHLLKAFHRHWGRGASAAVALQRAKQEMAARRDHYAHPFFWAGFVIYG